MVAGLSETLSHSPLLALATLFGAGLVTSLTPCIYPMIPITAGTLAGVNPEGRTRRRTIGLTITYVSGLALFYAVLGLIAAGRSNQRIAHDLVAALDTVKKHVTHVLGKLGAANRTEAAARARQLGLIP